MGKVYTTQATKHWSPSNDDDSTVNSILMINSIQGLFALGIYIFVGDNLNQQSIRHRTVSLLTVFNKL